MTHNLGFPRVGDKRQLKFALEKYWRGETSEEELLQTAAEVRVANWKLQKDAGIELVPVGDFSLYDHVLDTSMLFGNVPPRFKPDEDLPELDRYFRVARGRSRRGEPAQAAEMTKWFDTNYHYLVPEFDKNTTFALNGARLMNRIDEAREAGVTPKPVLLGPISYLFLGKSKGEGVERLMLLQSLIWEYRKLLEQLSAKGIEWVQMDEPILALDLDTSWKQAMRTAYDAFASVEAKILLTAYFGPLHENFGTVTELPVSGLHIDAVRGEEELERVARDWPNDRVLSVGVIDGRNVWKADLEKVVERLEPVYAERGGNLWVAPSCSLLHVPVDLDLEENMDPEIIDWLAFAKQKLAEVHTVSRALSQGRRAVAGELSANRESNERRRRSTRISDEALRKRLDSIDNSVKRRTSSYAERAKKQREHLGLPKFPTTTIGSFPQTPEIRKKRRAYKRGQIDRAEYERFMREQIAYAIEQQEAAGLDVLVHGEAERNDMVEYFGEQLSGYTFTEYGWVQSYGSRCVKPPIIYGDVSRPHPMTVEWSAYAQSLTDKPVKGMLTGPITMMQWAFVRNDQPRSATARQIALALRDEVLDLEKAEINLIQVDEPAMREGLPLRKSDWDAYLNYAVEAFRIATSGVRDETQIHTHMCYAEFNDIIESIAELDADVITIETSRSDMELLEAFTEFEYPNEIGPGVYDIHSPNIPDVDSMVELMKKAAARIPPERLWVNPDCGLKTRKWEEVQPSLENLVAAAKQLRA